MPQENIFRVAYKIHFFFQALMIIQGRDKIVLKQILLVLQQLICILQAAFFLSMVQCSSHITNAMYQKRLTFILK